MGIPRSHLARLVPVVFLAAACASLPPTVPAGTSTPAPSARRVILIAMENHDYQQVIGSPQAPYLNQLARRSSFQGAYFGVTHPSLPNYLALVSGDTFGITSDCTDCIVNAPNLADQLEARGLSWKSYQEDLPQPCFLGASSGTYYMKHNPFLYFRSIRDNQARCRNVVPLNQFSADLIAGALPTFSFVTPNQQHDMHDGTVGEADAWLAAFVPQVLASPAWQQDGLLLIWWDEGNSNAGCCGQPGGGQVPFLAIAPGTQPRERSGSQSNHYGLLRALEDLWGLDHLGHAADPDVAPLADLLR